MRQKRPPRRSYKRLVWLMIIIMAIPLGILAKNIWQGGLTGTQGAQGAPTNYILILGVDHRADDVGRSDTLMLAAFNEAAQKLTLLSVPRDTRVNMEGFGYDKINHAYAFGGHELSQSTVEELLGLKVSHYILIDTKAFVRIIDALGGVDIDVEKRMYYEDPWDDDGGLIIDLYPGEQHLDGDRAVQYVRYRDGEGDIGRIPRQQKFLRALLDKVLTPQIFAKLPSLAEEISGAIKTDMTIPELLSYAGELQKWGKDGFSSQILPGKPAYLADVSYWIPDVVTARQQLTEANGAEFSPELMAAAEKYAAAYEKDMPAELKMLADKTDTDKPTEPAADKEKNAPEQDPSETAKEDKPLPPGEISVMVINDSGINGAGAEVAEVLADKGFIISGVETGKTDAREDTIITTSHRNTDVFYGMPFPCLILDGGDEKQAVVNIGRDYDGPAARR
ncbi:MAG: LCP family protein [Selenomonadaceae bacterium]|nr:LCP family protein [Selenomonadaceae bacterium]